MKRALVVVAFLALCGAAVAGAVTGEWAQVGYDAQHTGASPDTGFTTASAASLLVKAQLQVPHQPMVPPAITTDLVYVPFASVIESFPASLLEGEPATGGAVYTAPAPVRDEPVVNDSEHLLWAVDDNGALDGFDARCSRTCGTLVSVPVGACPVSCSASPVVDGNTLIAVTSDGSLAAFHANCRTAGGCSPLWTANVGGGVQSTPTVGDGYVYVGTAAGVVAFPENCKSPGTSTTCPVAFRYASGDARADTVAFDPANHIAYWNSADGNLYGGYGCTTGTCVPQIVVPLGAGPVRSRPLISDGNGFVFDNVPTGLLRSFKTNCTPAGCALAPEWTAAFLDPTGDASPVLANGVVWLGDTLGFLYAFDVTGCGAPVCGALNPLTQLADGAVRGMALEVADGAVWAATDSYVGPTPSGPTSYLLTSVLPR